MYGVHSKWHSFEIYKNRRKVMGNLDLIVIKVDKLKK